MDLASYELLLSPPGQAALQMAQSMQPREVDYLAHFQTLCRRVPAELARSALEIAILRIEACAKFPSHIAKGLYLTREALEQATSYPISTYHASKFQTRCNPSLILDLGCSIGGDTLALAGAAPTIGIDLDLLRLRMASANLAAARAVPQPAFLHPTRFVQANLTHPLPVLSTREAGIFFDPARRVGHRRMFSVYDYQPALSMIDGWLERFPAVGVKLSPGVDLAEISHYQAEIEFVSLHGDLKECLLWFGPLRTTARQATILPGGFQMAAELPDSASSLPPVLSEPLGYLYEPDPAILRAGLVRQLAEKLGAAQLDPDIAYLTGQTLEPTPFACAWVIEAWFPFQLKRLRAYLRQRDVGLVTVKKRGSPLEPQALIRDLRLNGKAERILVLTHLRGEPIVIICLLPD